MKKLSIKSIIEFRGKSEKSKRHFATDIKLNKKKVSSDGGGDYWVSCLSALSNSYKSNDLKLVIDKMKELGEKYREAQYKRTKLMYKRNIDILSKYENSDFKKLRPSKKLKFLKKQKDNSILSIKGLPILVSPHHVFTFQNDDDEQIGAIWFIAKLDGFKNDELGMFTDILHRYLNMHFSKTYTLNPKYCIAVDLFNNSAINYLQLEKGEFPKILNSTLEELKELMK